MLSGDRPPRSGTLADRTYRQTSSVGICVGAVWVALWVWLHMGELVWVGVLGLLIMIAARVLRLRLGYAHATRLSVAACLLMIVAGIVHTGGMDGPLGLMMIILPLGPALALGAAESLRWGLVVLLLGGALWGWEAVGHVFPNTIPDGYADLFRALSQSSVLAGTLLSIYSYARMHELARERLRRSRGDLQRANAELRLSQQKLIVSEKMAALGRLTAGMAHEINSTLAGAINSVELAHYDADELHGALRRSDEGSAERLLDEVRESLTLGSTALEKIAAFVRRMRSQTSAGDDNDESRFSPGEEAETVLRLLQVWMVERGVTLHTEIENSVWLHGDPARFGQIVQNLVSNAVDAYDAPGNVVEVRVFGREGDLVLEVEDRGSGIPEEIRDRIFDHFFTTKDVGKGSGLGLALVHDLVTEYFGGSIELRTAVGRGTCFTVRLPLSREIGQ